MTSLSPQSLSNAATDARRLRAILLADAASCLAAGAVMALGRSFLAPWLGLPASLLAIAGIVLLPVAAGIAYVATRPAIPAGAVRAIILVNLAWVAASLAILAPGVLSLSALGYIFVIAQALLVGGFAALEWNENRLKAA